MEEPGRLQTMSNSSRLHFHFSLSCIGEGNGNPLQCSCLENRRDWGAWQAESMGSHRVGHNRSDLAAVAAAGKTSRSFQYNLIQILNDYTVEVRNRFKGIDQIECLMNYGDRFETLYRRQGARPTPRKKNAKKQNGCLRRSYK